MIGERLYRVAMPAGHDGSSMIGAIVFMHGYKGSAAGIMRHRKLRKAASDLGVALVAAKSAGNGWAIPGTPAHHDNSGLQEFDYFDRLIEDVTARFPIDRGRLMASGFSGGGMMVWNLACHRGDRFAAYVPMSGTFWTPIPESCPSDPVNLIHIHGTSDTVVPLAGRRIGEAKQGDVFEAVGLFRRLGKYYVTAERTVLDLTCERRFNLKGALLETCLHPGGHGYNPDYLVDAWRLFERRGVL